MQHFYDPGRWHSLREQKNSLKWKMNKSAWVLQKYVKLWSIFLGHLIKHKPLISEECDNTIQETSSWAKIWSTSECSRQEKSLKPIKYAWLNPGISFSYTMQKSWKFLTYIRAKTFYDHYIFDLKSLSKIVYVCDQHRYVLFVGTGAT